MNKVKQLCSSIDCNMPLPQGRSKSTELGENDRCSNSTLMCPFQSPLKGLERQSSFWWINASDDRVEQIFPSCLFSFFFFNGNKTNPLILGTKLWVHVQTLLPKHKVIFPARFSTPTSLHNMKLLPDTSIKIIFWIEWVLFSHKTVEIVCKLNISFSNGPLKSMPPFLWVLQLFIHFAIFVQLCLIK